MDRQSQSAFSKKAPVIAVVSIISYLWVLFTFFHCLRLLGSDGRNVQSRGLVQIVIFQAITAIVVHCLLKCIYVPPGTIPDGVGWDLSMESEELLASGAGLPSMETKRTGERRHCKWCLKYKPDRCHHCRVCNRCILRMDHHCPWVANCIGFRNHKYFFLLLIYAAIDLYLVWWCMFESTWWATRLDVNVLIMIAMIIGQIFAAFLTVLTTLFLGFHIWLMLKAMTTVEFCEKSVKNSSYDSSIHSAGMYANVCAVLGPTPMLWLVPVSLPVGDGLCWSPNSADEWVPAR
jgi:hypothetical protein